MCVCGRKLFPELCLGGGQTEPPPSEPCSPPPPRFQTTKDDLLLTDFEGALKFFRVQLPKRYRSEENAKRLMELACGMKVAARPGHGEEGGTTAFPCQGQPLPQ